MDIAAYRTIRSFFSKDAVNDSEWPDKFKEAIEVLEQIRAGEVDLTLTNGSILGQRAITAKLASNNGDAAWPVFDVDDVSAHRVDPDVLDRIESGRE